MVGVAVTHAYDSTELDNQSDPAVELDSTDADQIQKSQNNNSLSENGTNIWNIISGWSFLILMALMSIFKPDVHIG